MPSSSDTVPAVKLGGGARIPQLGFGVFQVPPEDTAQAVEEALQAGYRHIDTAAAYRNEAGVGEAIRASGLDREEVFVTTKVWNNDHGHQAAIDACHRSLERLGLDHVDLYLIHWPAPRRGLYAEAWRGLVDLREQGLARAIGVSNFQPAHLRRVADESGVTPEVNQVELHPRHQQAALRQVHDDMGIVTEAWSPLAQGQILDEPGLARIAEDHGKTVGQVVLRWHLQLGNVVIPKTVTPDRLRENFNLFDFELTDLQMRAIGDLEAGERIGPDPETFE